MSFDLGLGLSNMEWIAHGSIFIVNLGLYFFAKPLLTIVEAGREEESKVKILRYLNILVMLLQLIDIILLRTTSDYQNYFVKIGLTVMALYASLLFFSVSAFLLLKKFGQEKELDGHTIFVETYSSRLVEIILLILTVVATIYILIVTWGANSLLETTGIFGIIAAFLAFTSNIWAPDIISGLIILNTQMLEDGDVVVVDGYTDEYVISKVTFVYIILYDIRNNHRTLVRNSRFIQSKIDNLSRIASTDGIRKKVVYDIGYPTVDDSTADERLETLKKFRVKIDKMFGRAFDACCENENIKINTNKPFEFAITNTGNYALEYTLWIYLERLPNTKITATIRKHLMGTIYCVNEEVFVASVAEGIALSTPVLNDVVYAKKGELLLSQ